MIKKKAPTILQQTAPSMKKMKVESNVLRSTKEENVKRLGRELKIPLRVQKETEVWTQRLLT